ncbi:MAG: MFS transporter [Verrucomicrobiota bacterium]
MARNYTEQTFFYERWRAISSGILEAAGNTFLLLIAVRWFNTGALAKALVAASGSVGLVLTPLIVSRVESFGWPTSKAASRIAAVGAASFLVMTLFPVLPVFVIGSVVAMAASSAAIPLVTQMYQENYPEAKRGRLFSRTIMIRIGIAALFSKVAGDALSVRIEHFLWLLLVFAAAFGFASFCLARCPSQPLTASVGKHPFRALRFVRTDRLFRQTLICWMLMGFANLMMNPLRVEYLANPKYGLTLTVSAIALFTGVIPNLVRFVLSPVWGWFFDHMNFFVLRITLNLGFALGILAFFTSHSQAGLVIGAIIYGVSNAGGDVAWSLWVTKFAPPERVADYMAVHTFFTGVRGVIAPIVAFQLALSLPMVVLGLISSALIGAATLLLVPEIRFGRRIVPAVALIEEVSE